MKKEEIKAEIRKKLQSMGLPKPEIIGKAYIRDPEPQLKAKKNGDN